MRGKCKLNFNCLIFLVSGKNNYGIEVKRIILRHSVKDCVKMTVGKVLLFIISKCCNILK